MTPPVILLLESLHPDAEALLEAAGPVVRAPDPNRPPNELAGIQAMLTRGRGRIPAELMDRCPALRVIARAGAGLDNLDTQAAASRGIPVVHAPGANASTVAEHTMALMLDLTRGVTKWAQRTRSGGWEQRGGYADAELRGQTLGIIGLGNIGRRVAALASAFGMEVIAAEHSRSSPDSSVPRLPIGTVLERADVVSLHAPLRPETRGLIGPEQFQRMRAGALLINTARGELVDGTALRAALANDHLGGFAADVLEVEPPLADDPLLTDERVVLTPHVASLTGATYRALCVSTVTNVVKVLRGEAPDPRSIYRGQAQVPSSD